MNSLYFKIKDTVDVDKHRFLELFFKDWVDYECSRQVHYKVEKDSEGDWLTDIVWCRKTLRVDFEKQEDFLAIKLKGIPTEFRNFLEIVK